MKIEEYLALGIWLAVFFTLGWARARQLAAVFPALAAVALFAFRLPLSIVAAPLKWAGSLAREAAHGLWTGRTDVGTRLVGWLVKTERRWARQHTSADGRLSITGAAICSGVGKRAVLAWLVVGVVALIVFLVLREDVSTTTVLIQSLLLVLGALLSVLLGFLLARGLREEVADEKPRILLAHLSTNEQIRNWLSGPDRGAILIQRNFGLMMGPLLDLFDSVQAGTLWAEALETYNRQIDDASGHGGMTATERDVIP